MSLCWATRRNTLSMAALGLKPRWGSALIYQSCRCYNHYCARPAAVSLFSCFHPSFWRKVSCPSPNSLFPSRSLTWCLLEWGSSLWSEKGGLPKQLFDFRPGRKVRGESTRVPPTWVGKLLCYKVSCWVKNGMALNYSGQVGARDDLFKTCCP